MDFSRIGIRPKDRILIRECKEFGFRLRTWRKTQGLVIKQICKKIRIAPGSLSEIETGKSFPSYFTLCKFKYFYPEVNWDSIFYGKMLEKK